MKSGGAYKRKKDRKGQSEQIRRYTRGIQSERVKERERERERLRETKRDKERQRERN